MRIVYNAGTLSLLTNYRPNFCSECGEKIIRLHWRVWTNRRFCEKCVAQFRKTNLIQQAGATVGLVLLGILIGRALRREPPPLVIQRPVAQQSESSQQQPLLVEETYICGARTKKGKPCSRRVHGPVRCWQHKGEKAMLPQDKLKQD